MNMNEIELTQGLITIIDNEDYNLLAPFKWYAMKARHTFYAQRRSGDGKVFMHREIMKVIDSKIQIDHIDGNGLNNLRSNLRIVTNRQNCFNRNKQPNKSSKFKGVNFHKYNCKWRSAINIDGHTYFLGYFDSELDAALAYDDVAEYVFKEYANLNFK